MAFSEYMEEIYQHFGVYKEQWSNIIENIPLDEIPEIAVRLSMALTKREDSRGQRSLSYFADHKLAGTEVPCFSLSCRMAEVDDLARFASWYSDTVYIQDPFVDLTLLAFEGARDANPLDRARLIAAVALLDRIALLIESRLIVVMPSVLFQCSECHNYFSKLQEEAEKVIQLKIEDGVRRFTENVSFYRDQSGDGLPSIRIEGPEELVPHGNWYHLVHPDAPGALEEALAKNLGERIEASAEFVELFVEPVVTNLLNGYRDYLTWSQLEECNFLTSNLMLTGEESIDGGSAYKPEDSETSEMTATFPSLEGLALSELIDLRNREPESFAQFRLSLHETFQELREGNRHAAAERLDSLIKKEMVQIDLKARHLREVGKRTAFKKGVSSAAWGAIGALNTPLIPAPVANVKAFGDFLSALHAAHEAKSDEPLKTERFYFLWKGVSISRKHTSIG